MHKKMTTHGMTFGRRVCAAAAAALALLCTATSCSDEIYSGGSVAAGRKVTLTVSYQGLDQKIMKTRTVATDAENQLNNLQVFVFDGNEDESGNHRLVGYTFVEGTDNLNQKGEKGDVSVKTTTGNRIIYGVANTEGGTYNIDGTSIPRNAEEAANWNEEDIRNGKSTFTLEQFREIMVDRTETIINITSANFFMSGMLNNGNAVKIEKTSEVDETTGETKAEVRNIDGGTSTDFNLIKLYRVVAKIKFMLTAGSGVTFTPTGYTICNVPLQAPLITNAIKASTDEDNFENIKRNLVDTGEEKVETEASDGTKTTTTYQTFSFYVPGNRQNDNLTSEQIAAITKEADEAIAAGKSERAWLAREADTGTGENAKEFTNAPEYATYLILRGTYVGPGVTKSTDNSMRGNAVYYIHLGEFNKTNGYTDFNVERNCLYTYKVKVEGLNSIKIEAEKTALDDWQPGATEGYAFDFTSTGSYYIVDSHYEQVNMKFYKSDFASTEWDGFYFKINEPAIGNTEVYRIPLRNGTTGTGDGDYIKVGTETIYEKEDGTQVKYPSTPYMGIDDSWKLIQVNENDLQSLPITKLDGTRVPMMDEIMWRTGTDHFAWTEFTEGEDVQYKDIFKKNDEGQLEKDYNESDPNSKVFNLPTMLRKMAIATLKMRMEGTLTDETATEKDDFFNRDDGGANGAYREYTCFISENYYGDYPYANNKYWGGFVDTDPRMLLIAKKMDVSDDERSLYADLFYGIEQYPIYTFYNKQNGTKAAIDNGSFVIGYGMETIRDDTKKSDQTKVALSTTDVTAYENDEKTKNPGYGLLNQIQDLKQQGITKWEQLDSKYQYGAFACMSRNRDLNGDGNIDLNEIRWYCPDIEQYGGMWIGDEAIPQKLARLYTGNTSEVTVGTSWQYRNGGEYYYSNRSAYATDGKSGYKAKSQIVWAEEGFAVNKDGTVPQSYDSGKVGRYVRCVRNLNPPMTDLARQYYYQYNNGQIDESEYRRNLNYLRYDGYPTSWKDPYLSKNPLEMYVNGFYTKYYNYNDDTRTMTLPWVDPEAMRTTYSQYELIPHTERGTTGYVNRPKDKFVIATWNTSGQPSKTITLASDATLAAKGVTKQNTTTMGALEKNSTTICSGYGEDGQKWRAPNERELLMMYFVKEYATNANFSEKAEASRTTYSNPSLRYGWTNSNYQHQMEEPSSGYGYTSADKRTATVRCVRDAK